MTHADESRSDGQPSLADIRRVCPTLPGDQHALITHRIGVTMCQKRQREFYHRCHRCIYRGKAADFHYDPPPQMVGASAIVPPEHVVRHLDG